MGIRLIGISFCGCGVDTSFRSAGGLSPSCEAKFDLGGMTKAVRRVYYPNRLLPRALAKSIKTSAGVGVLPPGW